MIPYHRPIKIDDNWPIISNGDNCRKLEEEVKNLYDVEHVIACSSCTMGLLLSLQVMREYTKERTISTTPFTWYSSGWAIFAAGFIPQYNDINPETWNLSIVTPSISLVNHTFGNIASSCSYEKREVIYDAAHAFGAKIKEFGFTTVFSLAPTKMVTACEGGLILTNDFAIDVRLRNMRDKFSRMSELNAHYALKTLKYLDDILLFKKECFDYYKKHLKGTFQSVPYSSNYNTIGVLDILTPPEIEVRKYYQPLTDTCQVANDIYSRITCLPSWYGVDYKTIVELIKEYNESINNGESGLHRITT